MTSPIDKMSERLTRNMARFSSRRGFLSKLGVVLLAAPTLPLLPVARSAKAAEPKTPRQQTDFERNAQATDDTKCNYWKYCGSDGVLCSCCGGGNHTCPPGSEPSPIAWFGTCVNPQDGRSFVIAYRDCCGTDSCGRCSCTGQEGDMPSYRPQLNNDIIWCFGASSMVYHCSSAALVGLAN